MQHFQSARLEVLGFSEGPMEPISLAKRPLEIPTRGARSDLAQALRELGSAHGERPRAIIVVGDGRMARPVDGAAMTQPSPSPRDCGPATRARMPDEPGGRARADRRPEDDRRLDALVLE